MISSVYAQVHLRFQQLVDTIRDKSLVADRHEELKQFEDEFAKFKLWGGNLGAAHSGKTYEISLDYRLQEAQFYKTQVSMNGVRSIAPNIYHHDTDNICGACLPPVGLKALKYT